MILGRERGILTTLNFVFSLLSNVNPPKIKKTNQFIRSLSFFQRPLSWASMPPALSSTSLVSATRGGAPGEEGEGGAPAPPLPDSRKSPRAARELLRVVFRRRRRLRQQQEQQDPRGTCSRSLAAPPLPSGARCRRISDPAPPRARRRSRCRKTRPQPRSTSRPRRRQLVSTREISRALSAAGRSLPLRIVWLRRRT